MSNYETPDYKVLVKDGDFEIREYMDFYIVEYDNDDDPGIQRGFGTLFSYISSDNKENQKIRMTVPVIEEMVQDRKKMAFVVPGKFGDKIPEPNNRNLNVRKFNKGMFAAIRYSGFSNKQKEEGMKKKLSEWLVSRGYGELSNYMLAFYNAPFSLPMLRRNEILVRVATVS
ncbi:MAG: heme-binding protein [Clostridia bacterium]|nr:heme-binding protein [Clostridia bacterium]